jgi:magnesium chelatase family protein
MISIVHTTCIAGIDAKPVEVEVHCKKGKNSFTVIGLGDNAIKESRDRVISALRSSGFIIPKSILVNLAPAEAKKEGSSFDLAIALGVLFASRQVHSVRSSSCFIYGELSLDGKIKPVKGAVALVVAALQSGASEVLVPVENYHEASLVQGIKVTPVNTLLALVRYIREGVSFVKIPERVNLSRQDNYGKFSDVWGQETAKRALLIAAAGGHNVLMIGPPGCGKSMLASRFVNILPTLSEEEILEVIKIHSIAGLPINNYLAGQRPYRNPHHVVSDVGLVGGGSNPRPGEVSLAHNGVLFLDELPEYRRSAIESLRGPLECGYVRISRAKCSIQYPASFQLISAMNPCPCGRMGIDGRACMCSPVAIAAYRRKLSEPILDRIDLHVELDAVPIQVLLNNKRSTSDLNDDSIKQQIKNCRDKQYQVRGKLNAYLDVKEIFKQFVIESEVINILERSAKKLGLSARSYTRLLRLAVTISDLENGQIIKAKHIAEAITYRGFSSQNNSNQQYGAITG